MRIERDGWSKRRGGGVPWPPGHVACPPWTCDAPPWPSARRPDSSRGRRTAGRRSAPARRGHPHRKRPVDASRRPALRSARRRYRRSAPRSRNAPRHHRQYALESCARRVPAASIATWRRRRRLRDRREFPGSRAAPGKADPQQLRRNYAIKAGPACIRQALMEQASAGGHCSDVVGDAGENGVEVVQNGIIEGALVGFVHTRILRQFGPALGVGASIAASGRSIMPASQACQPSRARECLIAAAGRRCIVLID
jgi:hypothetical protein